MREPTPKMLPETVRVGTQDPLTQRVKIKEIKRVVRAVQPYHSVGEKGMITWEKKQTPVYRRHNQTHWTIFLEEVLPASELRLPTLTLL